MRTSIAYRITCPLCERLAMQPCRRLGTETMNLAQVHRARLVEARRKFHGAGSSSKAMSL
jgi:hypothetical protein